MKITLIKFLALILFMHSAYAKADASTYLYDANQVDSLLNSGALSADEYDDLMDLRESSGDVLNVSIPSTLANGLPPSLSMNRPEASSILVAPVMTNTSMAVQKYSQDQVDQRGKWGFEFIFIGNDGQKKLLTSYNAREKIRPGSTMKLFSSYAVFKRGLFSSDKERAEMKQMLIHSINGEADRIFKSISQTNKIFVMDPKSYLNDLIGYKMWDTLGRKSQVIDYDIARSWFIAMPEYQFLQDGDKFHPVNGSGLQQTGKDTELETNTVTPHLEVSLLEKIYRSGRYDEYKQLLPGPGRAGTLNNKFVALRRVVKGIYAKTGTLGNGKSLAGYIETSKGVVIFSIIGDDLRGYSKPAQAHNTTIENIVAKNVKSVL